MKFRTRIGAALVGSGLVLSGLALAAPAAHATTADCASAFGNQCGTFQGHDHETTPVVVFWDVAGKTAAQNVPVIGYGNDGSNDVATDLVKVEHVGVVPGLGTSNSNTISYSFVYVPGGHWSNLCVADTGTHKLSLRTCNGLQYQRFIAQSSAVNTQPVPFTGASGAKNTPANGQAIFNVDSRPFALMNVAYRLFATDNGDVPPSVHPSESPDPRILSDAGVALSGLGTNQLWMWNGGAS